MATSIPDLLEQAHIRAGEVHVIVGPMFAGKTTDLLRRIKSASSSGRLQRQQTVYRSAIKVNTMGNSHHRHHKHGNVSPPSETGPPPYNYPLPPILTQNPTPAPAQFTSPPAAAMSSSVSAPYAHVDCTLRDLSGQAEGFGRCSIGGLHGPLYHVTTLADDGPGSLRDGCRKKEPLWIVFEVSGVIQLGSFLSVSSYKTIDGRGQRIKLSGKGLRLKEYSSI